MRNEPAAELDEGVGVRPAPAGTSPRPMDGISSARSPPGMQHVPLTWRAYRAMVRSIPVHARTRSRPRPPRARRSRGDATHRVNGGSRSRLHSCCRWRRSASRGAATRPRSGAGSRLAGTPRPAPPAASPTGPRRWQREDRTQDLLNFNRWLEVSTGGDTELADLYERRFRDEFRPAFEAGWPTIPCRTRTPSRARSREELQARERGEGRQARAARRRALRAGQGGHRERGRLRVRHRVLRDRAVLRRHLAAVRVAADAVCSSWGSAP